MKIPTEIISVIFMFYFIKQFNIEYGQKIQVEGNTLTNITYSYLNTSVIDDWMDPYFEINHIHTIKIKIIKHLRSKMVIGMVGPRYNLNTPISYSNLYYFNIFKDGGLYRNGIQIAKVNDYSAGYLVALTLNLKLLCLSYSIYKNDNEVEPEKKGFLLNEGQITKDKYK